MFVEQLQCIPLLGIVAGGKYQSAAGIFHSYRQFGGGCRCGTDIDNIEAHAHQSTYNNVNHHRAGDAGIMSHDYGAVGQRGGTIYKCSVCCRVFTMSIGVSASPGRPPMVPRIPEMDFIRVIIG